MNAPHGDGTIVGPQPEQTANHTFLSAGTYKVIVIVTDTAGLSSRAAVDVKVTL